MYHIIIIISLSIQHYEAENQKSRRNVCASMQFRHCKQKIEKGKGLRCRVKVTALVETRKGQHASEIRPDRRQQEWLQQLGRITSVGRFRSKVFASGCSYVERAEDILKCDDVANVQHVVRYIYIYAQRVMFHVVAH